MKTHIQDIQIRGFKSFNKRINLKFGPGMNCLIGANGSGKCLRGDSLVHLADGNIMSIAELVEQKLKINNKRQIDDGWIAAGDGTEVLSLDTKTLKTVAKPIQAYVKRTSPSTLIKIRARSGREVVSTEYHPFFVLNEDQIKAIKAEEIREGQRIAVPRFALAQPKTKFFYELLNLITVKDRLYVPYKEEYITLFKKIKTGTQQEFAKELGISCYVIKGLLGKQAVNFAHLVKILRKASLSDSQIAELILVVKAKTSNKLYKVPWQNSSEFARFLGYLLAEGRLPPNSDQIWFTNGTQEIVEDYATIAKTLFGIEPSINEYKPNTWDVLIYSQPIRCILEKMGMAVGGTFQKNITRLFLSHSSDDELCSLLNGLYCGDGYISPASIEITTKSPFLANAIQTILIRLGITFNARKMIKVATNSGFSGTYTNTIIYGVENFEKFVSKIKLIHPKKQSSILALLGKTSNPNIDIIEVNSLVKRVVNDLGITIKSTRKDFSKLSAYCYNGCSPTKSGLNQLITQLFEPAGESESLAKLKTLTGSDIFWDEIVSIEKVPGEDWVYDLCVAEDHNFIANNIFVHNSNILDAMCFVVGKMSSKELRAENFGELLFKRKATIASEGEVSLTLDNNSNVFPVDAKKIEIKRKIQKKGGTQYKINGRNATRQQVLELMTCARIFPDGHNIIMQGDIARFVDMKSVEKRLVIEEVAGIAVYEDRKKKALTELAKVEEKLKEARIVLTEKESYMENLEEEKAGAEKYRDLQNELKSVEAAEIKLRMNHIENKRNKVISELQVKEQEISNLKLDVEISSKKIKDMQSKTERLEKEIGRRGGEESLSLQKEVENLRVGLEKSRALVASSLNEVKRIEDRKATLEKSLQEIESKIKENQNLKSGSEKEKQSLLEKVESLKKHEGEADARKLTTAAEDLENSVDCLSKDKEKLQNSANDIRVKMKGLEHEYQYTLDKLKSFEMFGDVRDFKTQHQKILDEIDKSASRDSRLALELGKIKKDMIKKEEELAKVRIHSYAAQEFLQRDRALKLILSKRKQIEGLHGTVAELGNVGSKYSTALSISAGSRMKNIVVENSDTAIRCLQLLKDSRAGIATFLPLDKLRLLKSTIPTAVLKEKGVIGLASELIGCDKKYKKLFEYVFRDTLVVEDVSTAKSLGISKYRMVTLDGDLFEKTGAITGGFRDKKANTGFREADLNSVKGKLENEISDLQARLGSLEKERDDMDNNIMVLRTKKAEFEGRANLLKDSKTDKTQLENISKKLKREKEKFTQSLEKYENELSELEKTITRNISERNSIRAKLKELHFGEAKKEADELNQRTAEVEAQLAAATVTLENVLLPEKHNIIKVLRELEKEKKAFGKQLKTEEDNIKKSEGELKAKEKEEETFYGKLKSLMAEKNEIGAAIRSEESVLAELNLKFNLAEQMVNNLKIDKAEHEASLTGLEQEYEPYKDVEPFESLKSIEDGKSRMKSINSKLAAMGNVNMRALEIFDAVKKEYEELESRVSKLTEEKDDVHAVIGEIEKKKKESFMKTYSAIEKNFREIHSKIATRNHAELKLENPENPFEAGVYVYVTDIKGKRSSLASLSGGEKVLVALAFIFAVQEFEPAPFYLLDEIDAALDKINSENVAKLLKEYSQRAQIVLVSHNDAIVSESDVLFGINMNRGGESNVVSIDLAKIEAKKK